MHQAFVSLTTNLCNHVVLCVSFIGDHFILCRDVEEVGGILYVYTNGKMKPTAFYCRQLRGLQCRYSAMEMEALALVSSIKHFAHYLWGKGSDRPPGSDMVPELKKP